MDLLYCIFWAPHVEGRLSRPEDTLDPPCHTSLGPRVSYGIQSFGISAGAKAHPDLAVILHEPLDGPSERFPLVGIRSA